MIKSVVRGLVALGLAFAIAGPAVAQRNDERKESGPLQGPKAYGDRGNTKIIGNSPIQYPNRPPVGADPVRYWKSRIISGPSYGGSVIIINGSPCYSPLYYSYGIPGSYSDSHFYGNIGIGGFNMGYSQRQSNYQYGFTAPIYPNVQRPVDTRTQQYLDELRERDPERTRTPRKSDSDADPDYYLHQKPREKSAVEKDPSLGQAIASIERAFRMGDIRPLELLVDLKENVILAAKGQSRKPLLGETYLELTRDALKNMKTLKFELSNTEPASNGAVLVFGKHTLQSEDGKGLVFSVGFVLAKRGEHWFITEVSADPVK